MRHRAPFRAALASNTQVAVLRCRKKLSEPEKRERYLRMRMMSRWVLIAGAGQLPWRFASLLPKLSNLSNKINFASSPA